MVQKLWLRAESKPGEERRALSPQDAGHLVKSGIDVTVERSDSSIYSHENYFEAGCKIAAEGSWGSAPIDTFILGLKELPPDTSPLVHRHIFFAHAYKGQKGWQELMQRFLAGQGSLYDLEYLTDDSGRRIAAFGYWAGFCGMALAILAWCRQKSSDFPSIHNLKSFKNKEELVFTLKEQLSASGLLPRPIIIGALGRCGSGAREAATSAGLEVTGWDLRETEKGGPFREVILHDIFVNCVFVNSVVPPFITLELLKSPDRNLSLICDVSCDPTGKFNPLPIYAECTDLINPLLRIIPGDNPLDLIAIDHLPSLLPRESSSEFSKQLVSSLLNLDPEKGVWKKALKIFREKTGELT